ncbi:hypothetical protein H2202_007759 [Exophiala xenobiotica]|nr:hypothetical protein H2202_007759 [Exophiala xenobiotica]KAK5232330.1 hypothetical protein LTR47_006543 [Exophiala xenobiotica]KAK5249082.1 hypothetical protein LTS06_006019 [Exophiala xenobiotica]KAK5349117.1 hypothetical protein LTR61_007155 [Exophiala xenobiotica]KAK5365606.1 hypothetical protein LTR11_008488 [Exophiala xenobiotica]
MSGAFTMPHALTGGPGYKANATYDDFLRKHSGFYRRHSAASNALEGDRRASQASLDANASAAAQAVQNVAASDNAAQQRRGSVTVAGGGAAVANARKGSVAVASDVTRKDSIFGLEPTGGQRMSEERRPSTSLASDLFHKIKGDHRQESH